MMMNDEQKKTAPEMAVSETENKGKENVSDTIVTDSGEKSKDDYVLPEYWNIDDLKKEAFDYLETIEAETYNGSYFGEYTRTIIGFINFLKHQTED